MIISNIYGSISLDSFLWVWLLMLSCCTCLVLHFRLLTPQTKVGRLKLGLWDALKMINSPFKPSVSMLKPKRVRVEFERQLERFKPVYNCSKTSLHLVDLTLGEEGCFWFIVNDFSKAAFHRWLIFMTLWSKPILCWKDVKRVFVVVAVLSISLQQSKYKTHKYIMLKLIKYQQPKVQYSNTRLILILHHVCGISISAELQTSDIVM